MDVPAVARTHDDLADASNSAPQLLVVLVVLSQDDLLRWWTAGTIT